MTNFRLKPKCRRFLIPAACFLLAFSLSAVATGDEEGMKVHPQLLHEEAGSPAYESAPPEDIKVQPQESEEPLDEDPAYLPWEEEPQIPPEDDLQFEEEPVEEIEAENIEPEEQMKETPPEVEEEGPAYPPSEY